MANRLSDFFSQVKLESKRVFGPGPRARFLKATRHVFPTGHLDSGRFERSVAHEKAASTESDGGELRDMFGSKPFSNSCSRDSDENSSNDI